MGAEKMLSQEASWVSLGLRLTVSYLTRCFEDETRREELYIMS